MYVYDGTPGAPIGLITSGSVTAFTYDYDPYGVPTLTQSSGGNGVPQNPYTFGGTGVRDRTTDWVHYANRYYSTKSGTFTQQDTIDAPLDPLNGNRYAYAGGDPINNIDPEGKSFGSRFSKFADSVITGAELGGALGGVGGCAVGAIAAAGVGCVPGAAAGATGGAVGGAGIGIIVGTVRAARD